MLQEGRVAEAHKSNTAADDGLRSSAQAQFKAPRCDPTGNAAEAGTPHSPQHQHAAKLTDTRGSRNEHNSKQPFVLPVADSSTAIASQKTACSAVQTLSQQAAGSSRTPPKALTAAHTLQHGSGQATCLLSVEPKQTQSVPRTSSAVPREVLRDTCRWGRCVCIMICWPVQCTAQLCL